MSVAELLLFSLACADAGAACRHLEVGCRAIESFEHGPVIFEVTLTNRGTKPFSAWAFLHPQPSSYVRAPESWRLLWSPRPWCGGGGGFLLQTLQPGRAWTARHVLHGSYECPAGVHEFKACWWLRTKNDDDPTGFTLSKSVRVTITPATAENRKALAARLEREFAALPPDARGSTFGFGGYEDALGVFSQKISGTQHKELIPVTLRAIERCETTERFGPGTRLAEQLISSVMSTDPPAAQRIFVDWLCESPPRINPRPLFDVWLSPGPQLAEIGESYFSRVLSPETWLQLGFFMVPEFRPDPLPTEDLLELLWWANEYGPCQLPDQELARLGQAKDFAVRAQVYVAFRDRRGP